MNIQSILNAPIQKQSAKEYVIWMYWDQGYELAPPIVKQSYLSWKRNNPEYEVIFIDDSNIVDHLGVNIFSIIDSYTNVNFEMAGKSDFLRLYILFKYGGCWVDATTLCLKPLRDWLPKSKVDFFIFRQANNCPDRQMVSWFMYSKQGNKLVHSLLVSSFKFLSRKRTQYCSVSRAGELIKNDETKHLISREGTGFKYLDYCQQRGTVPYFWMFYLWNEVCQLFPQEKKALDKLVNNYVQPNSSYDSFYTACVSKQTYRSSGVVLDSIREQRISYLNDFRKLKPVVSIHLPKTAGTYFKHILVQSLGKRVRFDYGDKILDYSLDALHHRNKRYLDCKLGSDFYHGHFYAKKYLQFKESVDFVTVLREPLELMISMYNYLNEREDDNPLIKKAKTKTFQSFSIDPSFINLTTTILQGLSIDDFSLIGFQDNLDSFLDKFETIYNIKLSRDINREERNITNEKRFTRLDLSAEFIKVFKLVHAKDYLFYNDAKNKFFNP